MMRSRLAAISAGAKPRSAAARSMLASPVYSGWKPEPSSRSAPTRPFTSTMPRVGLMTPAMILRSVDLPAPFSPITPSDSPRSIANDTSSSARNPCLPARARGAPSDEVLEVRGEPQEEGAPRGEYDDRRDDGDGVARMEREAALEQRLAQAPRHP